MTLPLAVPYHSDIFMDGMSHGDTSRFRKSILRGGTWTLFLQPFFGQTFDQFPLFGGQLLGDLDNDADIGVTVASTF
jgi:hypothetical protein